MKNENLSEPSEAFFNESVLRSVLESSPEGILCVDRQGRILFANRTAESMFGYPQKALASTPLERLLPERNRAAHVRFREGFLAEPKVRLKSSGLELTGRRHDGTEFPVDISLAYADTAMGRIAIAFVADISARRSLQDQLAQMQKMEAVGSLAGGLAHDLGNMLTIIIGCNEIVKDDLPDGDPARQPLQQALEAAHRAGDLCRRLLAFSRPQGPQARIVGVNEIVRGTVQMMRRLMGAHVRFDLRLESNLPNIRIDVGRLEQALVNLLVNARDAMPEGGTITVETGLVHLDGTTHPNLSPGGHVAIAVSDTGRGMDAEVRGRVFEPFFTTKAPRRGTGLGLTMVHTTVRDAGGDIDVRSEPGQGSTFRLYLPVVHDPNEEKPSPAGESPRAAGTILFVDDEPGLLDMLRAVLTRSGFRVLPARNADEALDLWRRHSGEICALVTDVVLPGKNGIRLAAELRGFKPDLPVLFLSGYDAQSIESAGDAGLKFTFLSKPFTRSELLRTLQETLRRLPPAENTDDTREPKSQ